MAYLRSKVDRYLATHLGFTGLDRFRTPASLTAMKHFVDFLHENGFVVESSRVKSEQVITTLRSQLATLLKDEMDSCRLLAPLWNASADVKASNETT